MSVVKATTFYEGVEIYRTAGKDSHSVIWTFVMELKALDDYLEGKLWPL